MNDFHKKLKDYTTVGDFNLDKGDTVAQDVQKMYEAKMKKMKVQFWWRFAVAAAITVYGALGVKYNTGRYIEWGLFTALVGANAAFMILLWAWQLDTKLGVLKELKQLRIEVTALTETKEDLKD
jgi:hypothetical protein